MKTEERITGHDDIFHGVVFDVKKYYVALPDGTSAFREQVEHHGGACVLAYEDGFVYLVRQYRLAMRGETIEVPAGKLSAGEAPEHCALRELTEETGLVAKDLIKIGAISPSPGYTNEIIHIYYAEDFVKSVQQLDEGELINVMRVPAKKAFEMVDNGEIIDSKTVVALLWLKSRSKPTDLC